MSDVAVPPAAPAPAFLGQATAVEQSRAVAEVQAAVVVAQQVPRDVARAIDAMRETLKHHALADRSFYSYSRGGSNITGASIHLARELARLWGNLQYGINELSRDDVGGESQMIAWAWDVQANIRSSTTFIVKHARDTKTGRKPLTDLRDVYENNANNGARRVREMIFAVLPAWFTDEAKELARKTLADGGGVPLPQRIANVVKAFAGLGVTEAQLVERFGPTDAWGDVQVANMGIVGRSLRDRETTIDDEFPRVTVAVTAAELTGQAPPTASERSETTRTEAARPEDAPRTGPNAQPDQTGPEGPQDPRTADPAPAPTERPGKAERPANGVTKGKIKAAAAKLGLDGAIHRAEYEAMLEEAVGHPVTSSNDLTQLEAEVAVAFLEAKAAQEPGVPEPDSVTAGETDDLTGLGVDELRALAQERAKGLGWSKPEFLRAAEDEYAQPFDDLDAEQLRRFVTGLTFARIRKPKLEEEPS